MMTFRPTPYHIDKIKFAMTKKLILNPAAVITSLSHSVYSKKSDSFDRTHVWQQFVLGWAASSPAASILAVSTQHKYKHIQAHIDRSKSPLGLKKDASGRVFFAALILS